MIDIGQTYVDLMAAVVAVQRQFIASADSRRAFNDALQLLVDLSLSNLGFIGEVLQTPRGASYLKIHATSNVCQDETTQAFFERYAPEGMEFYNLANLIGAVIRTRDVVISNAPNLDPRSGGLPPGHPPLDVFLGLPFFGGEGELVGMAGLANRPGGYDDEMVSRLQPLCDMLGVMIVSANRERGRREVEESLRASEARYRTFVDHATDALFLHDSDALVVDVNRQACVSLGYDREELIGTFPAEFDPDALPELTARVLSHLDAGEMVAFDSRHQRKDGTVFPVEVRIRPFWMNGQRYGLALARDISDRKQAEEKLRQSEERLACELEDANKLHEISMRLVGNDNLDPLLQEIMAVAISMTRADMGNMLLLDPNTGMLQLKAQVGFESSFSRHFHQIRPDGFGTACGRAIRTGKRVVVPNIHISNIFAGQEALGVLQKAGVRALVSTPLMSRSGRPIGTITTYFRQPVEPDEKSLQRIDLLARQAADLLERAQSDAVLRESEARLRTLLENLDKVAVQSYEPDGTITFWNNASETFYGYSAAEALGHNIVELLNSEQARDAKRNTLAEALRARAPMPAEEVEIVRRDGSRITVFASCVVHPRSGKQPEFFCFDVDITDRKRVEEELAVRQAELLHASRLTTMGRMVAALSHEVAQPLSAIGNFAAASSRILEAGPNGQWETLHEYIRTIVRQNQRCGAILQRLRDFSRRTAVSRSFCDVHELLRDSVELISSELRRHDIEMHFEVPAELPRVWGDPIQLQQVIVNLLTNARDAVSDQANDRRLITVRSFATKDSAVFDVEDHGHGISESVATHLFDPFFTTKETGMGIGLSICQSIVSDHGGQMETWANEFGGATFRVRLPLHWKSNNA